MEKEAFAWAKETIFVKLASALKAQNKSLESLFKDLTIKSDPTKINKRNFLIALKQLNAQIAVPEIDSLIQQLADPTDKVDLPFFYSLFQYYTGEPANPEALLQKVLAAILEYLQDQRLDSLETYFDTTEMDVNGSKVKVLEEAAFMDFFAKQLPSITSEERVQFVAQFKIPSASEKVNISAIDDNLAKLQKKASNIPEPVKEMKTFENMMEMIRVACAKMLVDIYLIYKEMDMSGTGLISKGEFEEGLYRINAGLDSEDVDRLFVMLDEDRDSKISYLDLAKSLETLSLKSQKVVSSKEELYPVFARIRNYIKDRKGLGIHRIFRREMMKVYDGRLYLQPSEFRNALTAMKINLDNTTNRQLEKYLDPFGKGMIDYLYFSEKLGYIHKPDTEALRPQTGMSGVMSGVFGSPQASQFLDQNQMIKSFLHRFSKFVTEHKIDLGTQFLQHDVYYTGLVSQADFRRLIERLTKGEFTPVQLNKVAERFSAPEHYGKVNYRRFEAEVNSHYRKMNIISKIFLEMYRFMIDNKSEDLLPLLEGKCGAEDKALDKKEFVGILEECCQIYLAEEDLMMVIQEFDTRGTGKIDLYEFDSQFKDFVRRKEAEGVIKRPDRHVVEVGLVRLREYCDSKGIGLMDVFKEASILESTITQYEFQTILRELEGTSADTDNEIYQLSAEVTDTQGRIDLNLLCKMYNELFNRSEENIEMVLWKKDVDKLLRKILDYSIKHNKSIEDAIASHDRERTGYISRSVLLGILKNEFGLGFERTTALDKLANTYDSSKMGMIKYHDFLSDIKSKLEDQISLRKYLSKLKSYLTVSNIHLRDKFIVEDFLHERFLAKDSIHKVIAATGFVGSEEALDTILNLLPKDSRGKINYVEFENEIKRAPDMLFEDEQAPLIKPDKIAPAAEVMDCLAKKVATKYIKLDEIMANHDYERTGKISYDKFVEILVAVQLKGYNKYDSSGVADLYADKDFSKVDYKKFVEELYSAAKKYEILNDKTGLHWAEPILEKMAVKLYLEGKDCVKHFVELDLLKPSEKTVSKEEFETGMARLNLKIASKDLERMAKELDTKHDGTVNVFELSNLVLIKSHQARNKYEHKLFSKIQAGSKEGLLDSFRAYDLDGNNFIPISSFVNAIRAALGSALGPKKIDYLTKKYVVNKEYVNYPAFVEDINREGSRMQLGENIITILDKLREGIRKIRINLAAFFETRDKSSKGKLPLSVVFEALNRDLLPEEEWDTLAAILDPYKEGFFEYHKLLELLWIEDEDPKKKEADALNLCRRISSYCKSKHIDLEACFIRFAKDKTGYMSTNDIKQAFDSSGIRLSYSQLNSLLYYQPISIDVSGRKNFLELLTRIFGDSSAAAKKLTELPDIVPEIKEASIKVERESQVVVGAQITPLEELKTYKPEKYKGYRSKFHDGLLENIVKYVVNSKIRLIDHFKAQDVENKGFLPTKTFFDTLNRLNIELNKKEQKQVLELPGVLENSYEVHYVPFINYLMEKDYQLRAEGALMSSKYQSATKGFGHSRENSNVPVLEIRELVLTDEEVRYAAGLMKALRMHMDGRGQSYSEVFAAQDPQRTGFISVQAFYEVLKKIEFKFIEASQLNVLYAYLKETREMEVSLKRIKESLEKGTMLKQYRTKAKEEYARRLRKDLKTVKIMIDRLREHMKVNSIPASVLREYANTEDRAITRTEFYQALKGMGYDTLASEADQIFDTAGFDNDFNEDRASLPKLLDLLSKDQEEAAKINRLDHETQKLLDQINELLKESEITLDAFSASLDVNHDGYISYPEFIQGVLVYKIKASEEDLLELAKVLDSNNNKYISINELGAYLVAAKKSAIERKKEVGIDDLIAHEIDKLFAKLDENGDGKVSEEELYRGLLASRRGKITKEEVKEIMQQLDANGNGYLDYNEFRNYMLGQIKADILQAEDSLEDLREKFKNADVDGNGWLSTEEMYELIKKEYPKVKMDELAALIEECDRNKDMKIDIDEFVDYFSKPFEKALGMKKNPAAHNGLLAIKAHRRVTPNDFMLLFDRIANGDLYFASFISSQLAQRKNLSSEGFQLRVNTVGLGYVDVGTHGITPLVAGYVVLSSATGVPIPNPGMLDRTQIVARTVKMCFYDEKAKKFVHNSAFVEAEWDENFEDIWNFNAEKVVGTNPIVFKWARGEISHIKLILELVIGARKGGKVMEVSNGWAEIPLEQLKVDKEYVLELKAGTPQKPIEIDPKEVRAERKGFFSAVAKALGSRINSQITVYVRGFSRLDKMKQVFFLKQQSCIGFDITFAEQLLGEQEATVILRAVQEIPL
eukprot:TRINITY_DN2570_c1_g1_i1.p1 TRINITY_DN2570_c1_g1~~TRINITY_DN2570_c1_g1_i1.p1  ORF type:complete len:2323 (+),score=343.15 TRINITY_DN2570_c1_g1_i1:72-6971(+)